MKKPEFKNKNRSELVSLLKEKKEGIRNFRFGLSGSKTRNVKEGNQLRKDIARILTVLNDLNVGK